MQVLGKVKKVIRKKASAVGATWEAQRELWTDKMAGLSKDPGIDAAVSACLDWILLAQEKSASADGGVARHYSLVDGWGASYPETTGYIIPTLLSNAARRQDARLEAAAVRALKWLTAVQFPNGAFSGSHIRASVLEAVVFDTGQILLGLAAGVAKFGVAYEDSMHRAARWLMQVQDADGVWRHPNPFSMPGDHIWETHVAWGLLEACRVSGVAEYGEAGMRNIRWAVSRQLENGWYQDCGLGYDENEPLTHTLAYTLRGIIEGYRFSRDPDLLKAAITSAEGLLSAFDPENGLPGRLDKNWKGTVPWICLTGQSQTALCWMLLHQETGDIRYLDAAVAANRYVRRTLRMEGPPALRGGVKGSFPVHGDYCRFQFINWACKFLIDACDLEADLTRRPPTPLNI